MNPIPIKHHWQLGPSLRPYTLVKHGDRLQVTGYLGYFAFGSVAGCALRDFEDVRRAIEHEVQNHGESALQWINALPAIIDNSGKTGAQKAMEGADENSVFHFLALGDLVWLEGQSYRLDKAPNKNIKLSPVVVYSDGSTTEGRIVH
jgi:hypothetical protein